MVGITSFGAYIPWNRLNRKAIFAATGWLNGATAGYAKGEKAVASHDEDSLSMGVAAGMDCLKALHQTGHDRPAGTLYLASTTLPYRERQNAAIAAAALGLPEDIRTADFSGSVRSGTSALIAAAESVNAGGDDALVCASDCRPGKPGSAQEHIYGDGAAAVLLGKSGVIASLEATYSVTKDFVGSRRSDTEQFDRVWEERWVRDEGYGRFIPSAIKGLLEKAGLKTGDLAKIVCPCPFAAVHTAIAKAVGADPARLQDTLLATVGDTGSAHALLMLAAALEEAKPGDLILVAGYGSGCDALLFKVTPEIEEFRKRAGGRGVKGSLGRRRELTSYEKFAAFRGVLPMDVGIRGEEMPPTPFSALYRERRAILSLIGHRCTVCGTTQFPSQRVCVNPECGAVDKNEEYPFAWRSGKVFTFTADNLAASMEPPAVYGVVDFDGGGRYWFDFTDSDLKDIKVGAPVELSFRRKYIDPARGVCGYFWKAVIG